MRPYLLSLLVIMVVMRPVQGSRLKRLEEEMKFVKGILFKELGSIRDEVKELTTRVELLENTTSAMGLESSSQDMEISADTFDGKGNTQTITAENYDASVDAEIKYIRKAYSQDKEALQNLKESVKDSILDLEHRVNAHVEHLNTQSQQHIELIQGNISLAKTTLSDFINTTAVSVSTVYDKMNMTVTEFIANASALISLKLSDTVQDLEHNLTTIYRHNDNVLQTFMFTADQNVTEVLHAAEHIGNMIVTNYTDLPRNLQLENQDIRNKIADVERMFFCNEINLIGTNGYDNFYPCERVIRLANASPYLSNGVQGRLEVRHNGKWGTVCNDAFQGYGSAGVGEPYITNNVNVVCRMFRFRECEYVKYVGGGSGTIWMDDVECGGGESSILECPHRGWGSHNCDHDEGIGFRMWN
ncbi:uncharacterized protein LOC128221217 [Mya arenaria]|uniref:uncharacterized protein LOC128221217 n=1 Tax=Mya arenaria TaxID=6604 RepID=UPI0022E1C2B1|nr:uncharacterized protein LOC128221217 [Mya arenaria]XP_052785682.1 uncharacterized protein LOC128221217 [Mya arenaria]XP_052785683.1 uncharacterized protein LOC128221217 [Mya arenaria]